MLRCTMRMLNSENSDVSTTVTVYNDDGLITFQEMETDKFIRNSYGSIILSDDLIMYKVEIVTEYLASRKPLKEIHNQRFVYKRTNESTDIKDKKLLYKEESLYENGKLLKLEKHLYDRNYNMLETRSSYFLSSEKNKCTTRESIFLYSTELSNAMIDGEVVSTMKLEYANKDNVIENREILTESGDVLTTKSRRRGIEETYTYKRFGDSFKPTKVIKTIFGKSLEDTTINYNEDGMLKNSLTINRGGDVSVISHQYIPHTTMRISSTYVNILNGDKCSISVSNSIEYPEGIENSELYKKYGVPMPSREEIKNLMNSLKDEDKDKPHTETFTNIIYDWEEI